MKKIAVILLILAINISFGQDRPPAQYIQPEGKISLAKTMPFFQAIRALNDISSRIDKIVIIDPVNRTHPINVEIDDKHWREALDLILRVNNLSSDAQENYIMIVGDEIVGETKEKAEEIHSGLREVNINAIFFEGNRGALRSIGINWNAVVKVGNKAVTYYQNLVGIPDEADRHAWKVEDKNKETPYGQEIQKTPIIAGEEIVGEISEGEAPILLIKALESKAIGELLANPSITVLEGQQGRIQVGQDFTIKQLDFAGNVTDEIRSTGIILSVTPKIIREDSITFIHLDVNAEKSSVTPGAISTIINKASSTTKLLLLDGERAVIAGLYSTDEFEDRAGIPILKDLPWWFFGLRYLFGYNHTEKIEKELIIIIKAELLPTLKERIISKKSEMELIRKTREDNKNKFKK